MNHWQTLLTFGPMWVGNKALQLFGWMGNRVDEIRSYLKRLQWIGGLGIVAGILISAISFQIHNEIGITIGRYVSALAGLFAAFCLMSIWIRLAAIAIPASKVASGGTVIVNQAVKFVPGASQVSITNVIDDETTKNILREVMSVFAWIMFVVMYISVIPAYRNVLLFIGCVIMATFIGMATYGWAPENKFHIQEKFSVLAAIMLLCSTLWLIAPFVIPQGVSDRYDLLQAKQAANHKIVEGYQKDIATANARRETLARQPKLSNDEQEELDDINQRIDNMTSLKRLNSPDQQEVDPSGFFTGLPVGKTTFAVIAVLAIFGLCIKRK